MDPAQRGQVPGFLYRWFFFLALMQFSLLMVLAWWGPGSARKAVPFEADQPVVCEDFKQPSHLPLNFPMFTLHCEGESCLHSRYVQPEAGSPDFETHIVAVEGESPRPRSAAWPHITVRLQPSDKPIRLVLVSKESVQWDLKGAEPELLKDVHVVTPQGARISGMTDAEEVPLYWHGQSTLCLHPHSWWDHDNPNNEFQRFLTHVRILLGAPEDSFQGSLRGKIFEVPFYDSREDEARHVLGFRKKWLPADRGPASEQGLFSEGPIYELHHHVLRDLGWGKVHRASRQTELMEPIPEDRTFLARRPDGKFHLLTDGARLLLYSGALQQELAIAPPEGIADFRRLRLASFAEDQQSVVAYFQVRGGVVMEWRPQDKRWSQLMELYRIELDAWLWEDGEVWGVRTYKSTLTLMRLDRQGRKVFSRDFLVPWELGQRRTRFVLERDEGETFLLKHYSAAAPVGRWFQLDPEAGTARLLSP